MEMPLWIRILMPVMLALMLLIIAWLCMSAVANKERHRARLRVNLAEDYNKKLLERIAYLEKLLEQANIKKTSSQEDKMNGPKVFISYSSKDVDIALSLQKLLTENYIPSFMAPASIPAGSNYTQEIPNAICNAFAMVVMLSGPAQSSHWVAKEVDLALEENIPIIPYWIDEVKLSRQFRFMLGQCQQISATDELIGRLQALQKETIKKAE